MYGPEHPDVANTLTNLGNVQQLLGELEAARATQQRALTIKEAVYGPEHPDVAITLTSLGNVQEDLGQRVEAEANVRRALGIYDASLPADHPNTRLARRQLARLVSARGEVLMNVRDDDVDGHTADDRARRSSSDASVAEQPIRPSSATTTTPASVSWNRSPPRA